MSTYPKIPPFRNCQNGLLRNHYIDTTTMSQHLTDYLYVSTSALYSASTQTLGNRKTANLQMKSYSYSSKNCWFSTVREKFQLFYTYSRTLSDFFSYTDRRNVDLTLSSDVSVYALVHHSQWAVGGIQPSHRSFSLKPFCLTLSFSLRLYLSILQIHRMKRCSRNPGAQCSSTMRPGEQQDRQRVRSDVYSGSYVSQSLLQNKPWQGDQALIWSFN